MSLLKRREGRVSANVAISALIECPAPWQPIPRDRDELNRRVVRAHGDELLEFAQARPAVPVWLLVRYLPSVPVELVERSLEAFRREIAEFCDLVGDTPDLAAAEAWEDRWRASLVDDGASRRGAD
ncbi:MAG: hypothetical protein R6X23_10330 [Acidimicrobiia bacterium]